jgi:ParB family chromosome partitioning protein
LSAFADGYPECVAGRRIEQRHATWAERLPREPKTLWETLSGLPVDDRQALLAHCVALTLNALRGVGRSSRALAHADLVAAHVGLDMTTYWQATADGYFGRVSKAHILAAVQAAKPEAVGRLEGLKKDAMAHAAADLLGTEKWLPPLLRPAAAVPA